MNTGTGKNVLRPRKTPRTPRFSALAHHGVVEAVAFFFEDSLLPMEETRRRILQIWTHGAQVYSVAEGLLLVLPRAQRTVCALAPGQPLTRWEGRLLSAPLGRRELQALNPPSDAIVILREGRAIVETLREDRREDLSTWLNLSAWQAVPVNSLGRVLAPELSIEEIPFEVREKLGGVPDANPGGAAVLEDLRTGKRDGRGNVEGSSPLAQAGLFVAGLAAGLSAAWESLQRLIPTRPKGQSGKDKEASTQGGEAGAKGAGSGGHSGTTELNAFERFFVTVFFFPILLMAALVSLGMDEMFPGRKERRQKSKSSQKSQNSGSARPAADPRLQRLFQKLLLGMTRASGLSRLLGRRQARYIFRMMEMFERGDLDEALRHAIPLGGSEGMEQALAALGVPSPRDSLAISPSETHAASTLNLGRTLLAELVALYRRAFERLEEQGEIEKAAFILAELLHENEEAVAFLERHGRLRLAAEMAEARELPPGLVVRQWFLAGDRERAILIARRTGAFADAVLRLQKSDPRRADLLRVLWANALAEAGDYAGAVEAIWSVRQTRHIALEWMNRCIAVGGIVAARMLARKLELAPETFEEVRASVRELMEDESIEQSPARKAFASALCVAASSDEAKVLGRAAYRALLRDAGQGVPEVTSADLRVLLQFTQDAALRVDAPALPAIQTRQAEALQERDVPLERTVTRADSGALPLYDAAYLPGGRCVVALGEAGARLLTRDGRTIVHWDQPAHRLAVSDRGDRAIALAPRGETWRLARLDFVTRRAEYWGDIQQGPYASDFDGSLWFAAVGQDFCALDATAKEIKTFWRRPGIGKNILSIARSSSRCQLLTLDWQTTDVWGNLTEPTVKWERWQYDLPGPVLQRQVEAAVPFPEHQAANPLYRAVSTLGYIADVGISLSPTSLMTIESKTLATLFVDTWGTRTLEMRLGMAALDLGLGMLTPETELSVQCPGEWVAVSCITSSGGTCVLVHRSHPRVCMRLHLEGAKRLSVRLTEQHALFADDLGRLLALDLTHGVWLRDLRMS